MKLIPKIKIIGIGGAGGNTVTRLMKLKIEGVELIALNTDIQDLRKSRAHLKIRIGKKLTQGLGTGMNVEMGKKAAQEQKEEIKSVLKDAELVFITFGAGGGTGSGAAPVVAEITKELGILTITIFTTPFSFEGELRKKIAENTIRLLKERVDGLISVSNDKLLESLGPKTTLSKAFSKTDEILKEALLGISELITSSNLINVDFANVKSILKNSKRAFFGIGKASGEKRAQKALSSALSFPLIEIPAKKAKGVLFGISGKEISLGEVEEITKLITKEIHPEAKIVFGAREDPKLKKGEIKVILILSNFSD